MRSNLTTVLGLVLAVGLLPPATAAVIDVDGGTRKYLIEFAEPGLLQQQRSRAGSERFNPRAPKVLAQRGALVTRQAAHTTAIAQALGHAVVPSHYFLVTHSGIAVDLSTVEAERVRGVSGVSRVEAAVTEHTTTFRSPQLIGADTLWNGGNSPSAMPAQGEGTVIGILDTGIDVAHPSFANDASCGHGVTGAAGKLLSFVDCSGTDSNGQCNGPVLEDPVGHGTHVAATAAGNRIGTQVTPAPLAAVSGVAPCARLRAYKVCIVDGCSSVDIQAGLNSVLLDGDVDVVNFSISGGIDPWLDNDRRKLDLLEADILVAAASGNMGSPFIDRPQGWANHRGPWVLSVGATTHDARSKGLFTAAGSASVPTFARNMLGHRGTASPQASAFSGRLVRYFPGQAEQFEGCTAGADGAPADLPAFPAGYFNGAAALLTAANCPLLTQINNAVAAGAQMVLVRPYFWSYGSSNYALDTRGAPGTVPVYGIGWDAGDALQTYIQANPQGTTLSFQPVTAEALAPFSLRGPLAGAYADVSKPNLTAPGVGIYAAAVTESGYAYYNGTSMASPHAAGAAALVRQLQPDWSVTEVMSALMLTATTQGLQDDFLTPWNADSVGSGRVDLSRAARAGLVLHETPQHFLDANPTVASVALRDLNLASVRDADCIWQCEWTRTLRTTLSGSSHWVATGLGTGVDIAIAPASFTLLAPAAAAADTVFADSFDDSRALQALSITASPQGDLAGAFAFGEVLLTETGGRSPPLRITVAVSGKAGGLGEADIVVPAALSASAAATATPVTLPLQIENIGNGSLQWSRASSLTARAVWRQPGNGSGGIQSDYSTTQSGGIYVANDFVLPARTALTRIVTPGFDNSNSLLNQPAITWALYADLAGKPAGNPETSASMALWTHTSAPGSSGVSIQGGVISLDLAAAGQVVDLPAGSYWLAIFPTYTNTITGGSVRWNWLQAALVGSNAQIISPRLFGATAWTSITSFGVSFRDTAFDLDGTVGGHLDCGASWLSSSPNQGSIAHHQGQAITLTLNPAGLGPGEHLTHVCIDSNDADTPTAIVPVRFTITAN